MSINKAFRTAVLLLFLFAYAVSAHAAWQGPVTILEGRWGSATGEFGFRSGDTADEFPGMIAVTPSGKILIGDSFNIRIQIFNSDGSFNGTITPKGFPLTYRSATYWPLSLFVCGDQSIYTERNEYIQIYDFTGTLAKNLTDLDGGIISIDQKCNFYTYNPSVSRYSLYSTTGQLIRTSTTRPPELGQIKTQALRHKKYRITISYPDKTYLLLSDALFMKYVRDKDENIYGVNSGGVWRFNQCGKEIAELIMPTNETERIPYKNKPDKSLVLDVEYGEPVVAPTGDVYAWKKTDSKYAIVKWTWKDDPKASAGCGEESNSKRK